MERILMMNLSQLVRAHAARTPDKVALVYGSERIGYAALARRSSALAAGLIGRGITPGDVVAVLMKNSAAFIEIALATSEAGAVLLPINFRLSAEEVAYITGHAGAALLFADRELADKAPFGLDCMIVEDAYLADTTGLLPLPIDPRA
jgi:fatty-acyl-CoA synthase